MNFSGTKQVSTWSSSPNWLDGMRSRSKICLGFLNLSGSYKGFFVLILTYSTVLQIFSLQQKASSNCSSCQETFCCSNWKLADWHYAFWRVLRETHCSGANVDYTPNVFTLNASLFSLTWHSFHLTFTFCNHCLGLIENHRELFWIKVLRARKSSFYNAARPSQNQHILIYSPGPASYHTLQTKREWEIWRFTSEDKFNSPNLYEIWFHARQVFVCTTDDNAAVIMQVQFPREYILGFSDVPMHVSIFKI